MAHSSANLGALCTARTGSTIALSTPTTLTPAKPIHTARVLAADNSSNTERLIEQDNKLPFNASLYEKLKKENLRILEIGRISRAA